MSAYLSAFHANKYRRQGRILCLVGLINGTITAPGPVKIPYKRQSVEDSYEKTGVVSFSGSGFLQCYRSICSHSAKIRIGTDPTYAPFESKNARGELVGFDIDLAKELCKRINTQCTFVENPLDALIPSLKAKKIDAIMSSLSITEKRQQEIAFTDKLYAADSRLVVAKDSAIQPTIESLKVNVLVCCRAPPRNVRQRTLGAKRY